MRLKRKRLGNMWTPFRREKKHKLGVNVKVVAVVVGALGSTPIRR